MQPNHRMIRSIGTSIVALFLVAGAAFATSSFVGARSADPAPVSFDEQATGAAGDSTPETQTEEPTATIEAETGEPSATAETEVETAEQAGAQEASDDHGSAEHQAGGDAEDDDGAAHDPADGAGGHEDADEADDAGEHATSGHEDPSEEPSDDTEHGDESDD